MRLKPPPGLVHAVANGIISTLRFHRFGVANIRRGWAASPTGTVICCLWHQSLLTVIGPHQGKSFRIAALASLSGDGEIIADYLRRVGIRPVRGSSARGSARAAKELYEALAEGWNLAIACDGPRGPFKRAKTGPLEVARRHRVPIVPIAARASRELTFRKSWDSFRVPLPRAHVAICYGEPILYPPEEPSDDELAARALALGRAIDVLEARATELVNRFKA
jgi:lysophospholipid acyltransferase (LPLAT)-like uncharacterized protein